MGRTKAQNREYMREYMRARRAAEKAAGRGGSSSPERKAKPAPLLAALESGSPEKPAAPYTRDALDAGKIIAWIEDRLLIPTGQLAGRPFRLADFQKDFIRAACAPKVKTAALTLGRKNGKTSLISTWALYHVCESRSWEGSVVSIASENAKQLTRQMSKVFDISGLQKDYPDVVFHVSPAPGRVRNKGNGATLYVLSSDKSTGHSLDLDFVVFDELGELHENAEDLPDRMLESTGYKGGRLIAISTIGKGNYFADMLAQAEQDDTGYFVSRVYKAPVGCDPGDREAWHAANPGLRAGIKSLENHMIPAYLKSQRSAKAERAFLQRELNLPGGAMDAEAFVPAAVWKRMIVHPEDLPPRAGPCWIGLDLGDTEAFTAAVVVWENGRLETFAALPETPDLEARGHADSVGTRYMDFMDRGELITTPGRSTDWAMFLDYLGGALCGADVQCLRADMYGKSRFHDIFDASGLRWPIENRRKGYGSHGVADVRDAREAVLSGELRMIKNELMNHHYHNARLEYDKNDNVRVAKYRSLARIDAVDALVLAASQWERARNQPEQGFGFFDVSTGQYI